MSLSHNPNLNAPKDTYDHNHASLSALRLGFHAMTDSPRARHDCKDPQSCRHGAAYYKPGEGVRPG